LAFDDLPEPGVGGTGAGRPNVRVGLSLFTRSLIPCHATLDFHLRRPADHDGAPRPLRSVVLLLPSGRSSLWTWDWYIVGPHLLMPSPSSSEHPLMAPPGPACSGTHRKKIPDREGCASARVQPYICLRWGYCALRLLFSIRVRGSSCSRSPHRSKATTMLLAVRSTLRAASSNKMQSPRGCDGGNASGSCYLPS
jgi:hypothetical protein